MRFVKMHGLGNDYVYVDLFHETLPEAPDTLAVKLARAHFGVGSDGLILIEPSATCDARMRVFNADGSEAEMCGNGVRCVGKYLYDAGIARRNNIKVETASGAVTLALEIKRGVCVGATVDMGVPTCQAPVTVRAAGRDWTLTPVTVGNPHAVALMDAPLNDAEFFAAGPVLERHEVFPARANIEFLTVLSRAHAAVRVWERGSGETQACGSGACAALVAGVLAGVMDRKAQIDLPGGALMIEWRADDHVLMTGPATLAFTGEWLGGVS